MSDNGYVRTKVAGTIGWIELSRPTQLNALSPTMFRRIASTLRRWAADDDVRGVVLSGTPGRAFSAGGDVRVLHRIDLALAQDYWSEQFALDLLIASYRKPFVALVDGIAMGAGLGMAMHSRYRVVTERARMAMPETLIGLVPDAGATFVFGRAPGATGEYLATTGAAIGAADAIGVGIADLFVASDELPELVARLRAGEDLDETLSAAQGDPGPSPLLASREWLDPAFAAPTLAGVVAALADSPSEQAHSAADELRSVAPTAASVAMRLVRAARGLSASIDALEDALLGELRANSGLFALPDRAEGIRARVIDKDRAPRWTPARLDDVEAAEIDRLLCTEVPDEFVARIR